MASNGHQTESPQRHRVGEHWSGANPVPTVQKFVEHLDKEKKERDIRIDEENKAKQERQRKIQEHGHDEDQGDVSAHKAREVSQAKTRMVTDPTTGREIGVEDQDETSMDAVINPTVSKKIFKMTGESLN